jgi:hypothetical protein
MACQELIKAFEMAWMIQIIASTSMRRGRAYVASLCLIDCYRDEGECAIDL